MASSFGLESEAPAPDDEDHAGHDHGDHDEVGVLASDAETFTHPWAQEMYKQGVSFNGDERSKLFWGRGDGKFVDVSDLSGADSPLDGRAVLATDFDDDGDSDLFIHNLQRERHELFRNETDSPNGFVKVRLYATESQYEAIGATVVARGPSGTSAQVLSRGAGFLSCQAPELVFGAPGGEKLQLEVRWPGGAIESFGVAEGGSRVLLVEGTGAARALTGAPSRLLDPLPAGVKMLPGEQLPELILLDGNGERQRVDPGGRESGGYLYLNFWASYCGPCVREIPALKELDSQGDVTVISISVDATQDRARAQRVLDGRGVEFDSYFLSLDDEDNASGLDRVVDLMRLAIPTTLVVDEAGRLVEVIQGPLEDE